MIGVWIRSVWIGSVWIGSVWINAGCNSTPQLPHQGPALRAPPLHEISGLVQSKRHSGVFWAHNDSLDQARLFAINEAGELLGEHLVPQATNVDWEDITMGEDGVIYVADSGNNFHWRSDLMIYGLREPKDPRRPHPKGIEVIERYMYRYPTQERFPPLDTEERCFDAEALFYRRGELYLIGKCFWGDRAPLFWLPRTPSSTLVHLNTFKMGDRLPPFAYRVTGVDYQEETDRLAILTYRTITLYELSDAPATAQNPSLIQSFHEIKRVNLIPHLHKQVEAIAWKTSSSLIIGNEQRGLFHILMGGPAQGESTKRRE